MCINVAGFKLYSRRWVFFNRFVKMRWGVFHISRILLHKFWARNILTMHRAHYKIAVRVIKELELKNLKEILLGLAILGLSMYVLSSAFKKIYDCNKKGGILVEQAFSGYVCIDKKELK